MAIIDVLDHADKTTGSRDWNRVDQRRRTRTWRQQCKLWITRTMQDPGFADAYPDPIRPQVRNGGLVRGRSIRWWIQGVARKEGVVEIESLRKQIRGCVDSGLWEQMLGAFDAAVARAVKRGMVIQVGSVLVPPRFASRIMPVKVEAAWTHLMVEKRWVRVDLKGDLVIVTAYPGYANSFTRSIDLRTEVPGLFGNGEPINVDPKEVKIKTENDTVSVTTRGGREVIDIPLEEILWVVPV
jgi:hypothetical protein